MTLSRRLEHWLPIEPLVCVLDDNGDGFHECNLELGGRIVATRIVNDDPSVKMMMRDFDPIIREHAETNP